MSYNDNYNRGKQGHDFNSSGLSGEKYNQAKREYESGQQSKRTADNWKAYEKNTDALFKKNDDLWKKQTSSWTNASNEPFYNKPEPIPLSPILSKLINIFLSILLIGILVALGLFIAAN